MRGYKSDTPRKYALLVIIGVKLRRAVNICDELAETTVEIERQHARIRAVLREIEAVIENELDD